MRNKFACIKTKFDSWYFNLLVWREKHIKERNFVLVLALVVGIISGFAALLLKYLIHVISGVLTSSVAINEGNYLYLLWPVLGILLTSIFVRYVVRDNISHGVTRVLYAISQKKSRLKPHNMWASLISSSVTIGFGGSVGAEGPIVYTGAAIGSNLGSAFHLSPRVLMILVGCGAAAGIAGIFKAPIAGMLFTIEVLMLDLTAVSVLPLMISSVAAASIAYTFTGYEAEFFFSQSEAFITPRIPYAIVLGIFCGFVSLYFTNVMGKIEQVFSRLGNPWLKFIVGGVVLSSLIFLFPPLYGEGYGPINSLLNGNYTQIFDGSIFYGYRNEVWMVILFIALIILTKVFATSATNGGGGVGGTFAPSLYVGCMAGFLFAFVVNTMGIADGGLSVKNFALMGMAGVMSGVMHAPLTSIFLIAELTGGYNLFVPLMIVSLVSYLTKISFEPNSVYTTRLAKKGQLLTHHKDKAALTLMSLNSVVERHDTKISPDMKLGEMVLLISREKVNVFPVTDGTGHLLGIIELQKIRKVLFRQELYNVFTAGQLMEKPVACLTIDDPMQVVMDTIEKTGADTLPVVDRDALFIGFVSKAKLYAMYRQVMVDYSEE